MPRLRHGVGGLYFRADDRMADCGTSGARHCGTLVTPASLALIGATYPKDERNGAIGIWAAASALTTAGGPVLGGWLTQEFGWQYIFAINPPLALIAVVLLTALRG